MDILDLIHEAANDMPSQVKEPVATVPGLTLHVDGDYMAYYASGNDDCTTDQARLNAVNILASAKDACGADKIVVHNTASGCHKGERYVVATVKPYQAQRTSDRKPKNYHYMRDWLLGYTGDRFVSKTWTTREADDGIGACALHACGTPAGYAAILTRDKDMRMLPGLHVEWLTRDTVKVPAGCYDLVWKPERWAEGKEMQYGLKFFWLQMLMGDTADHIPGLEGYCAANAAGKPMFKPMGEKTAEKLLEPCRNSDEAFEVVRELYRDFYNAKGGEWADRFCEQASLLWMRTDNVAQVADFARHNGFSRINSRFCEDVWAAVERLETRVRDARTTVDALAS